MSVCDLPGGCQVESFLRDLNDLFADAVRTGGEAAFLQRVLDSAMVAVGGDRGFLALVEHHTGDLVVVNTTGLGWTPETARLRLSLANATSRGITGHVALTAEPYIAEDVAVDPHYVAYFRDVRSEIAVPICGTSGQSVGVINIESTVPARFEPHHVDRLVSLAHAAAAALRVQGFRSRESALIEIGNTLTTTLDIDRLMRRVLGVVREMLRFEDCTVFLRDPKADTLVLTAATGILAERLGEAPYRLGEGITGWIAEHGEAVRLVEPRSDPRWRGICLEFPQEEIGALLAVPITGRGGVLGVLRVVRRRSPTAWFTTAFSEGEERVLCTIGSQLGAAIENVRSHERLLHAERMAAWGELSARAAHMIGNRTFALKGDLNEMAYLLDQKPCEEIRQEIVELSQSMGRGVERLEEILREFRDFVVATQITLATCDLAALIRETVEETFPRRSTVRLHLDLDCGTPPMRCDAQRLKRAFSEIIENALSFQPEGGVLRIALFRPDCEQRAAHRLSVARQYVGVRFDDEGPGVKVDQKDRIFQPFHTTRTKGMGLGLSIVKGIVEAHNGVVAEIGQAGEGASFVIFLPADDSPPQAESE